MAIFRKSKLEKIQARKVRIDQIIKRLWEITREMKKHRRGRHWVAIYARNTIYAAEDVRDDIEEELKLN